MNSYRELKKRFQQEVNALPIVYAFGREQFEKKMRSLGLDPSETDKIYDLAGTGGFYLRTDAHLIHDTFARHAKERRAAIDADLKGEDFIFEMFCDELANHDYVFTQDLADMLESLGLTPEDIEKSRPLKNGLKKAIAQLRKTSIF